MSNKLSIGTALGPRERENSFTARNGGPTWPEDHFLSPFVQRRREMAHPVLTKGFLQLSPQAAMLPGPSDPRTLLEVKSQAKIVCASIVYKLV